MAHGSGLMAHRSGLTAQGRWRMAHGLALVMLMTAALHATRAVEQEPCAPARLTDTGLYAAGSGDTIAAGGWRLLAAVSAVGRRRHEGALDLPAAGIGHRHQQPW